jgi:hypothetical protein
VVDCARGTAPPPAELSLAWDCQRWNALPDDGGVYAQEWILVYRMNVFTNIYDTIMRVSNMYGEQIHQLTTGERRIIRWLRDEKVM